MLRCNRRNSVMALAVVACSIPVTGGFAVEPVLRPSRVPPYGIVQFGCGRTEDPEIWAFLARCHVNVCESISFTALDTSRGWKDRAAVTLKMQACRAETERVRQLGVTAIGYVAYHSYYGDYEQRTDFFDFYDNRWEQFADYLGLRLPDPIEWTQRDKAGEPIPFTYHDLRGYWICPNNPHWLAFLNGTLRLLADCGLDGVRYDGPTGLCWCEYCQKAFRAWLAATYTPAELAEQFRVTDLSTVQVPTTPKDRLTFPWRLYIMIRRGQTVAETRAFMRERDPDFVMSYNYGIGPGRVAGSSCLEYLSAAGDYALVESDRNATGHAANGGKYAVSAECKYLLAASSGKPVNLHYYVYASDHMGLNKLAKQPRSKVESMAVFWQAAVAEGMAGGCPHSIIADHIHPNGRQAVIDYADFFYRCRPLLANARTYANVAVLASASQTLAGLPTGPLAISRFLSDHHVPHKLIIESDLTAEGLGPYDALVLPELWLLGREQAKVISNFVTSGKGLVAIGPVDIYDEYNRVSAMPPLGGLLGVQGNIFPKEPFRRQAGRGRVAWFPNLERPAPVLGREPLPAERMQSVADLVPALQWAAGGEFSAYLDAPEMVELNLMRRPDGRVLLVHLMNYNIEAPAKLTAYSNLRLGIRLPKGAVVERVVLFSPDLAQERVELPTSFIDQPGGGRVAAVMVPRLEVYDLVAVMLQGATLDALPADALPPLQLNVRAASLAERNQKVPLDILLANRSDVDMAHVTLKVTVPPGWSRSTTFSGTVAGLEAGARKAIPFELSVPRTAGATSYGDIVVEAELGADASHAHALRTQHRVRVVVPAP